MPWQRSWIRDPGAFVHHRDHQHVRGYPLRPGFGAFRQSRPRGLAECRGALRHGAGATRLGPLDIAGRDIANPASLIGFGRHAAGLAGRAA